MKNSQHILKFACMAVCAVLASLGVIDAHAAMAIGFAGIVTPGLGTLFQQNSVLTVQNGSEVLRQNLYDHLLYPLAGSQTLSFFTQCLNQGITSDPSATVGDPKNIRDTNMQTAGQLSSGLAYNIEEIAVYFYPGTSAVANTFTPTLPATTDTAVLSAAQVDSMNDVKKFYESGLAQLNILQKQYAQITPLRQMPPQTRIAIEGALATADTNATTAIKLLTANAYPVGRNWSLEPAEISLQPAVSFSFVLAWTSAYPTNSGKNGRVGVEFGGLMMRAAQ